MKKLILPFLLILSSLQGFSQSTFQKSYEFDADDYGNNILVDSSGVYVAGSTNKSVGGNYDGMLMKFDTAGNFIWQSQFGGSNDEVGRAVAHFYNGYVVAGSTKSFSTTGLLRDIMISYVDTATGYQGSKIFGLDSTDEFANDVISTLDSGLLIVGQTRVNSDSAKYWKMFVIRTNKQASPLWMKTYGFPYGNDVGLRVIQLEPGNFIAIGYSGSGGNGRNDAYIVNFDDSGMIHNQILLGGAGDDDGRFFTFAHNQIIIGGVAGSTFGLPHNNIFLTALNPDSLTIQWSKTYGGAINTTLQSLNVDPRDGNLVVGGVTPVSGNAIDGLLFKVDSAGNTLWSKTIGSTLDDYIQGGTVLSDGSNLLVGYTNPLVGNGNNVYMIRTDSGNLCNNTADFLMVEETFLDSLIGPTIADHVDSIAPFNSIDTFLITASNTAVTIDLCASTGVRTFSFKDNKINIYPNPTSGKLMVESSGGWNSKVNLSVYNMLGSEILRSTIPPQTKQFSIDLSSSPKGMYIISFNDGSTITTEKISLN
ncbi:MAG: hypothetical protein JWN78_2350 [Bacteroidota bacterium]|nr:hypothetical protein [Bacteroidota bacterium]